MAKTFFPKIKHISANNYWVGKLPSSDLKDNGKASHKRFVMWAKLINYKTWLVFKFANKMSGLNICIFDCSLY